METRPLDNIRSLQYFSPELVLIAAILLLIVWDLAAPKRAKLTGFVVISLAALAYSAGMSAFLLARENQIISFRQRFI